MSVARSAALVVVTALWSCSLDDRGAAERGGIGGAQAGNGGSLLATDGGWTTGGTSGAATGGTGTAGTGAGGGSGGTGGCSAVGVTCSSTSECCSGLCGPSPGASPDDCNVWNQCAECDDDSQCKSGRCDQCTCMNKQAAGGSCDEASDCTSGRCGPAPGADVADCSVFNKCVQCDDDSQCPSGRCDQCTCMNKQAAGAPCDENSDCVSQLCGPGIGADPADCNILAKCAECDADSQCKSGRCDACTCQQLLPKDGPCDENSDCQSKNCAGGKCK
jgi:hypothetical protein